MSSLRVDCCSSAVARSEANAVDARVGIAECLSAIEKKNTNTRTFEPLPVHYSSISISFVLRDRLRVPFSAGVAPDRSQTTAELHTITGDHSKQDEILLVKIAKYIGFRLYRRSYLIWSPVSLPL